MNFFGVFFQESTLTGWHVVGQSGRTVWSVHRQTPPYLSIRNADVVTDLGSSYYWNAPGSYLGNKVRSTKNFAKYAIYVMYIFCTNGFLIITILLCT